MKTHPSLALFISTLTACGGYTTAINDREPFEPLPVYTVWWGTTEMCSGISGDFTRVSWYTASSIVGDQAVARGAWSPPHDIIIVRSYEEDELTVRHEMLHDLLDGDSNHESALWATCDLIPK